MQDKKGVKNCEHCSTKIYLPTDHFVIIGTCNRPEKPDDYVYFHFLCFADYWNQKVMNKAKSMTENMQKQAMKIFYSPKIKLLLSQIKGSDQILSMLSTPLSEDKLKRISERVENDRKSKKPRTSKKRKTKMQ